MTYLKALPHILNFGVVVLIGLKTLDTGFNSFDTNLSLIALIISVIIEIVTLKK